MFSHYLILSQTTCGFRVHGVTIRLIRVSYVRQAERTTSVLIASEFGYRLLAFFESVTYINLQMAVSARSGSSNSTTPLPFERPFGSY